MGLIDFFFAKNIDGLVKECEQDENAMLIDVRTTLEYKDGHIPNSVNVPLSSIDSILCKVSDLQKPLYVYCLSGRRANDAVSFLKRYGYTNVKNIGGINGYHGRLVR